MERVCSSKHGALSGGKQQINSLVEDSVEALMYITVNIDGAEVDMEGDTVPLGIAKIKAKLGGLERVVNLYITGDEGPTLIGRQWLREFGMWPKRLSTEDNNVNKIEVFQVEVRLIKMFPELFKNELDRLEAAGHIEKVQDSEWETPIVPVRKDREEIRLCGNFKLTVNPNLIVNKHPLPNVDDIFVAMQGVSEYCRECLTIVTHKGLYRYKNLPEGIASGLGDFQKKMEHCLVGIKNVAIHLDNIHVTGKIAEEHFETLKAVCHKLQESGLRVNRLSTSPNKVKAIVEAPISQNVQQLESFLGFITFYARFFPDRAKRLKPLHECTKGDTLEWTQKCEDAVKEGKGGVVVSASFTYQMEHLSSKDNGNCDALSRLLIHDNTPVFDKECYMFNYLTECVPILDQKLIKQRSEKCNVQKKIIRYAREGWISKDKLTETEKGYYNVREELTLEEGRLMRGIRVVIPGNLEELMLSKLHESHPGIVKMKSMARSCVWWPGIDKEIESTVKSCEICAEESRAPEKVPLTPWSWPGTPWTRIHSDFLGPFFGKRFMIMIDAHSKWPEVIDMGQSATAQQTVDACKDVFVKHGYPKPIVTDSGSQYRSKEFFRICEEKKNTPMLLSAISPSY
ncbi:uncharacterized protein K02A2.6-like [Neodiprion lecontei]|uniref:RNA-directed DNA polymerase n=1 Tax=Neodiprion lecontei TaxID=441921 RepID=A0A6J0C8Y1_NEOLC|nr:uncharacterized protein K02A2.6-like [Neodiprion lecontei]